MKTAVAVIFSLCAKETARVPFADMDDFRRANPGLSISKVVWEDGTWSWGKCWYFADNGDIARVGAGAYGDLVVWRHPDYDARSAELHQKGYR